MVSSGGREASARSNHEGFARTTGVDRFMFDKLTIKRRS